MSTGRLRYKCRNCGTIFLDSTTANYETMNIHFISLLHGLETNARIGMPPDILEVHHCGENVSGVADLIGLVKEES